MPGPPRTTTAADPGPPHDDAAEQAALGAMMLSQAAVADVTAHIGPADYYQPAHATIHAAIAALADAGQPTDPIAVADYLGRTSQLQRVGGGVYLHTLIAAVPTVANAAYHAGIVAEHATLRRLIEVGTRITQLAQNADRGGDTQAVVERARAELDRVAGTAGRRAPQLIDGATFVLDAPTTPPAIWGDGTEVLWAAGEALLIVGPPGVGKTTLVGQVLRARLGLADTVLGWTVRPTGSRVLYLACDRPPQISRSMRRIFANIERPTLAERLTVWRGPTTADLARDPRQLLRLARDAAADTVIIDSLKDVAIRLSEDETGAGLNLALQTALAAGVEILALHHQTKHSASGGKRPDTLADVYGSAWITAGAGSVILLWGEPGDPVVDIRHLKYPAEEIGPLQITHHHENGQSEVTHETDLLGLIKLNSAYGMTAQAAAAAMFTDNEPSKSQVAKARRKLDRLVTDGHLVKHEGSRGGSGLRDPDRWYLRALQEVR